MKLLSKIIFSSFLLAIGTNSFSQYVTLEGKQFRLNGNNFYPLVINYNLDRTHKNVLGTDYYYITPAGSYGQSGDYECAVPPIDCNQRLQLEFTKIIDMGFNTIRCDLSIVYRFDQSSGTRKFTFYYNENVVPLWQTTINSFDLSYPNFNDPNSDIHFDMITNLLDQAAIAGLKVILVCGAPAPKDANGNPTMWQTYDSQAASDFAVYLAKLATVVVNKPALLAYDFINEPIYNSMYRDGANNSLNKETLCQYVKQWYDAIKPANDPNHLITIGSATIDEMFYFDPGIMKLDFYSPHIYNQGHPFNSYDILNGFERYKGINYWMSKVYPMPWIIGETGFAADDRDYPATHLDNITAHKLPPWMFGYEADQADFAEMSLEVTRNALGSGYAWWAFQNVYWFDLNSPCLPGCYQQDFFGLLHWGDGDITQNNWYDKPAVLKFDSYLDVNGQPPPANPSLNVQPSNYFDPYDIKLNWNTTATNNVVGHVIDNKGNDIENAVIMGTNWLWTEFIPLPVPTTIYHHDVAYTFTQPDGTFEIVPYNYYQPTFTNPHRIVSIEISAVGAEKKRFGALWWPFGEQQMTQNINTVDLKKIINGYDAIASNEIVNVGETRNYYGRNKLTAYDLILNGNSNLTARNEINVNTEFHASNGSEVHIFPSDAFPDCNDFDGFLRIANPISSTEQQNEFSEKEIEIKFSIIKELKADIFPNPSNGNFTIVIQNPLQNEVEISIDNLIGKEVWKTKTILNEFLANFDYLAKGMYIIHFSNQNQTTSQKLIIN